jgi:hypothetical protein
MPRFLRFVKRESPETRRKALFFRLFVPNGLKTAAPAA